MKHSHDHKIIADDATSVTNPNLYDNDARMKRKMSQPNPSCNFNDCDFDMDPFCYITPTKKRRYNQNGELNDIENIQQNLESHECLDGSSNLVSPPITPIKRDITKAFPFQQQESGRVISQYSDCEDEPMSFKNDHKSYGKMNQRQNDAMQIDATSELKQPVVALFDSKNSSSASISSHSMPPSQDSFIASKSLPLSETIQYKEKQQSKLPWIQTSKIGIPSKGRSTRGFNSSSSLFENVISTSAKLSKSTRNNTIHNHLLQCHICNRSDRDVSLKDSVYQQNKAFSQTQHHKAYLTSCPEKRSNQNSLFSYFQTAAKSSKPCSSGLKMSNTKAKADLRTIPEEKSILFIKCSYCDKSVCKSNCTRACEKCRASFCTFCSTVNYDRTEERNFCFDCNTSDDGCSDLMKKMDIS